VRDNARPVEQMAALDGSAGKFIANWDAANQTGVPTYFCDPHKPWQKGAVENANGRLRRFQPRKTNLDTHSQRELDHLAAIHNNTPRKCIGFKTPDEIRQLQLLLFEWDSTYSPRFREDDDGAGVIAARWGRDAA